MRETQEGIECPRCLGGTNPDYALSPCPECWGALKIPQVSSPLRSVLGRLYQRLLTGVTKLSDAVRIRPLAESKLSPGTAGSTEPMGEASPGGRDDH